MFYGQVLITLSQSWFLLCTMIDSRWTHDKSEPVRGRVSKGLNKRTRVDPSSSLGQGHSRTSMSLQLAAAICEKEKDSECGQVHRVEPEDEANPTGQGKIEKPGSGYNTGVTGSSNA